jgi:NitT/TauT family transport system substrate-binding protein
LGERYHPDRIQVKEAMHSSFAPCYLRDKHGAMRKSISFRTTIVLLALAITDQVSFGQEKIRVATASLTSPSVAYLLVGRREGFFKDEGLQVELLNIRGELAVKTAVAGEVAFATQSGSSLAAAVRGIPVKILAVIDDKPPWELIAQPQIKSFAQLKGGTIGVLSLEGSVAIVTRQMLRSNGIDPVKDVTLMAMGSNEFRLVSLKGKVIQATLLDPVNSYQAQKDGFTKLASASEYVSSYLGGGIVVGDEKVRPSPDRIVRFLRAGLKGLQFYRNRREPTIAHMIDFLKMKDVEAVRAIYDSSLPVLTRDGTIDEKSAQNLIEDMKKVTGVKRDIRAGEIFDFSFTRRAWEDLKAAGWKP